MRTDKVPLSVAIITKNEEERLPECLASVSFADEVVVVDSGSTDRTVEIARAFGAAVYAETWQGFGRQKQLAIDRCHNPWVLVLDADERVGAEAQEEIRRVVAGSGASVAYSFPRQNFFSGRWIRHMGWWPDRVVRLFKKEHGWVSPHLVHESVLVDGPVGELANPIIHLTNRDLHHTLEKINAYSTAGAEELFLQGRKASVFTPILRFAWTFVHNYFFRLGFLDGSQGLVVALSDAVNRFYKFAKLNEMNGRKAGRSSLSGREVK